MVLFWESKNRCSDSTSLSSLRGAALQCSLSLSLTPTHTHTHTNARPSRNHPFIDREQETTKNEKHRNLKKELHQSTKPDPLAPQMLPHNLRFQISDHSP
ncbi:hypothetical protein RchiOBHm_Chr7g0205531 [Rosa chinensis]|uniref:Uncharacterized protein n=1 Tax=Rosa chinensis TaxID=74649 RepID=A0A2P6P8Z8_ROSCH|nr:hypothetical protein RchiOBHm_Chr7g0205531 [Rosa chinensis]